MLSTVPGAIHKKLVADHHYCVRFIGVQGFDCGIHELCGCNRKLSGALRVDHRPLRQQSCVQQVLINRVRERSLNVPATQEPSGTAVPERHVRQGDTDSPAATQLPAVVDTALNERFQPRPLGFVPGKNSLF